MRCGAPAGTTTRSSRAKDGLLFGYFETPDSFQAALDGMSKEAINARWQDFMAPYFENLSGAHADESMVELEEVFHLE